MDDTAYVRPGTSAGFRDTKRGGTFQPSDSDVARKLPKYDWVKEEVYVTPSTQRICVKEPRADSWRQRGLREKKEALCSCDRDRVKRDRG